MKHGYAIQVSLNSLALAALVFLGLVSLQTSAHTPKVPASFKQLVHDFEQSADGQKSASLLRLMARLSLDHPTELLHIYADQQQLISEAPIPIRIAIGYFVCVSYYAIGQHESAGTMCSELAEQSKQANDKMHESLAYSVQALLLEAKSSDEDAIKFYSAALETSDNAYPRAVAHFNMARLYGRRGMPELGFDHLQKVVELVSEPGIDQPFREVYAAYAYEELGDFYEAVGQHDQAKANYDHAFEYAKQSESRRMQISILRKLVDLHLQLGEVDSADKNSQQALELSESMGISSSIAASNSGRAVVLLAKNKAPEALSYARKAHDVSAKSNAWVRMRTGLVLARVFSALGDHREALELIGNVEKDIRESQWLGSVAAVLRVRSQLETAAGNATAAAAAMEEAIATQQTAVRLGANRRMEYLQLELDQRRHIAKAQQAVLEQRIAKAELARQIASEQVTRAAWVRNVSLAVGLALLVLGYLIIGRVHNYRAQKKLQFQLSQRSAELDAEAQKRSKLEAELRQAQKLEAIGQLTGGVAHDFNNLMTVVISSSELLEASDNARFDRSEKSLISNVKQAARTASSITAQLLAFARTQSLNPKPTNISEAIASIEGLLRRSVGECLHLSISSDQDEIWCNIDVSQLNTALLNLVLNARDASSRSGAIRVHVGREEQMPEQPSFTRNEYAVISVSDDGVGMSDTDLERVIEPFYSTKKGGHGNGLGLSMVYGFAKQSEGALRLTSSENEGTTATIWLPTCTRPNRTEDVGKETEESVRERRSISGRALVVEDTAAVRDITARILGDLGYEVEAVQSADDARERIESGHAPALLFTDLAMPGAWDGLDLARWVKQYAPETTVLIASGYASQGTNVEDFSFIGKPFSPAELKAAVRQAVGEESPT